jgi:1-phosphatidylinositol phosphodiesterase
VQDFYEVKEAPSIQQKITYAKAQLERSGCCSFFDGQQHLQGGSKKEKDPLFVNFLSASNFWNVNTWPEKIAAEVNPAVVEHLCREHMLERPEGRLKKGDWSTGVVVCDWVGLGGDWDLVRCVVGMNSRLVR